MVSWDVQDLRSYADLHWECNVNGEEAMQHRFLLPPKVRKQVFTILFPRPRKLCSAL